MLVRGEVIRGRYLRQTKKSRFELPDVAHSFQKATIHIHHDSRNSSSVELPILKR